jgi:hypothetical protein
MARPKKQVVDYFPHDTDAGDKKTLVIIQNKFGNDGYAFWFKLLQLLGKSPGHYYSFRDPSDWEFLLAKTHISVPETATEILETLATLGAIDKELYEHKIIWSQNFVDRLADVYDRRQTSPPERPDWRVIENNNGVSGNNNLVYSSDNPQTKLKETKLKETKLNEGATSPSSTDIHEILQKLLDDFKYCFGHYGQGEGGERLLVAREPTPRERAQIRDLAAELVRVGGCPLSYIAEAFKEASEQAEQSKMSVSYVRAILLDWLGVKRDAARTK